MGARTKARKRAIDVLFSADVRGIALSKALADEAERAVSEPSREASWLYAREIVDGVIDHQDEIDDLIRTYSRGWTLDRMPAVDRAILRMGVWEVLYNSDIPDGVAISEAVDQATILSTDDSAKFVNGLLGKIGTSVAH